MKKQSMASRMDESLGMRRGKESSKKQSYKARRDESMGMKKAKKKSPVRSKAGKGVSGMDFSAALERFNMKKGMKEDNMPLSKPADIASAIKRSQYAKNGKPKVRLTKVKGK